FLKEIDIPRYGRSYLPYPEYVSSEDDPCKAHAKCPSQLGVQPHAPHLTISPSSSVCEPDRSSYPQSNSINPRAFLPKTIAMASTSKDVRRYYQPPYTRPSSTSSPTNPPTKPAAPNLPSSSHPANPIPTSSARPTSSPVPKPVSKQDTPSSSNSNSNSKTASDSNAPSPTPSPPPSTPGSSLTATPPPLATNTIWIQPPYYDFVPAALTLPIPSYLHFAFPPFPHATNHSIAQSSADHPCTPYANTTAPGFWSGVVDESWYIPISPTPTAATNKRVGRQDLTPMPVWELYLATAAEPVYFFDAGGTDSIGWKCVKYGVVGVVNPVDGVNGGEIGRVRSLATGSTAAGAGVGPPGAPRGGEWVSTIGRAGTTGAGQGASTRVVVATGTGAAAASASGVPRGGKGVSSAAVGGIAFAGLSVVGILIFGWCVLKKRRDGKTNKRGHVRDSSSLEFRDSAPASGPEMGGGYMSVRREE
ncbi:uncharacterized protein BDZ99DRAFT_532569, partial [Mytilinidion resinicola]